MPGFLSTGVAVRAVSVGYPRREDIPGRSAPYPGADAPPACSRLMELADPADQGKSLIREYGSNFTAAFDTIPGPVPGPCTETRRYAAACSSAVSSSSTCGARRQPRSAAFTAAPGYDMSAAQSGYACGRHRQVDHSS
jgi:hypothetical protein